MDFTNTVSFSAVHEDGRPDSFDATIQGLPALPREGEIIDLTGNESSPLSGRFEVRSLSWNFGGDSLEIVATVGDA